MVEFPAKRVKMKRSRKVKTVGSWSVLMAEKKKLYQPPCCHEYMIIVSLNGHCTIIPARCHYPGFQAILRGLGEHIVYSAKF